MVDPVIYAGSEAGAVRTIVREAFADDGERVADLVADLRELDLTRIEQMFDS